MADVVTTKAAWPTISVILPTMNRCWTLGRQLDCILPQLVGRDQLIVVTNGCTDKTFDVLDSFSDDRLEVHNFPRGLGVCKAFNQAERYACCQWILGANDHNELSPGAITAWRTAAINFPDTRVMFGHVDAMSRLGWIEGGGYVKPEWLPAIWSADRGSTHGAATFIRRDAWGVGYRPELEWMADQEQSLTLTMRHGCVDIPELISHVEFRPGNFSQGHGDPVRYNDVMRAWRALIDTEEFADVKEQYLTMHKIRGFFAEHT